jgi:hypothetical protein
MIKDRREDGFGFGWSLAGSGGNIETPSADHVGVAFCAADFPRNCANAYRKSRGSMLHNLARCESPGQRRRRYRTSMRPTAKNAEGLSPFPPPIQHPAVSRKAGGCRGKKHLQDDFR